MHESFINPTSLTAFWKIPLCCNTFSRTYCCARIVSEEVFELHSFPPNSTPFRVSRYLGLNFERTLPQNSLVVRFATAQSSVGWRLFAKGCDLGERGLSTNKNYEFGILASRAENAFPSHSIDCERIDGGTCQSLIPRSRTSCMLQSDDP